MNTNSSSPNKIKKEQFIELNDENQGQVLLDLLNEGIDLLGNIEKEDQQEFILRAILFLNSNNANISRYVRNLEKITCVSSFDPLTYNMQGVDRMGNLSYSQLVNYIRNPSKIYTGFQFEFQTESGNKFKAKDLKEFLIYTIDRMIEDPKFGLLVCSRKMEYVDEDDRKLKQRLFKINNLTKENTDIYKQDFYKWSRFVENLHFKKSAGFRILFVDIFHMTQNRIKTINQLRKYTAPVFPSKFKIKQFHPAFTLIKKKRNIPVKHRQLHQLIEKKINLPDCRLELYQNLTTHPDYGYIVATLIYMGCVQENYPMEQLQYSWISMRNEILKTVKSLPSQSQNLTDNLPQIYYKLQKSFNYTYCSNTFNFITQYYLNDYCNCECGTLLAFKLCSMLPKSTERFMCILTLRHIQLVYGNAEKQYIFETTAIIQAEMNKFHFDKNEFRFGITNERVLALFIIGFSVGSRLVDYHGITTTIIDRKFVRDFIAHELGIKPFTGPVKEIGRYLNSVNTGFLTNPIDITILFFIVFTSFIRATNWNEVISLYRKHFITDYQDFFNGKVYTRQELNKRQVDLINQLQKINNDYPATSILQVE